MSTAKWIFLCTLMVILAQSANGGLLDAIFIPTILQEKFQLVPIQFGYRLNLEEPDGSKREEVTMVVNPGTPEEDLVVMGTYSVYDEKTDTDTITMYTADKNGYKPRYMLKNRKLSISTLKTMAGDVIK